VQGDGARRRFGNAIVARGAHSFRTSGCNGPFANLVGPSPGNSPPAVGPPLGGALLLTSVELAACLLINVPLGLLAFPGMPRGRVLVESREATGRRHMPDSARRGW